MNTTNPRIRRVIKQSVCCDCDWMASTMHYSRQDLAQRLIDHAVATGHDIESVLIYERNSVSPPTTEQPIDVRLN